MDEPIQLPLKYEDFQVEIHHNLKISNPEFNIYLHVIEDLFDCQQQLFHVHLHLASMFHEIDKTKIFVSAYYRNIITLLSAVELTKQGFKESARIVMRQVFEFLFIGKYCSVSSDEKYIKHWTKGGHVDIDKQILSKIASPTDMNFRSLWKILCQWNHATKQSQQATIRFESVRKELLDNLGIIIILLECNYHLLTKHYITRSASSLGKRYAKEQVYMAMDIRKRISRSLVSVVSKEGKNFIKDYKQSWKLK